MKNEKINEIMENITEDGSLCIIRDALEQYEENPIFTEEERNFLIGVLEHTRDGFSTENSLEYGVLTLNILDKLKEGGN